MARWSAARASRPRSSSPLRRFAARVCAKLAARQGIAAIGRTTMRRITALAAAAALLLPAIGTAGSANAAEIRLLASNALKSTLEELAPQFERASEHKLIITYGATAELKAE